MGEGVARDTREPAVPEIDRDGAVLHRGLASAEIPRLAALLAKWPEGRAGVRISGDPGLAALLGPEGPLGKAAAGARDGTAAARGAIMRPVRAVLFDKSDRADWSLGWHQDRTIALRERAEVPGFGPWSVKQGITHVEPPFAIIEAMVTLRIHIDPVDAENAPLLVALGSHRLGRIASHEVEGVAAGLPRLACLARTGDVWVYRTPILHASHAARPGRRRRVLQVDYADADLPAPLAWLGV